jgi:lipopolysaccharide biosynthesis glycosyltransferase
MKVVKEREISSSKNEEENVKNSQIITATLAWTSWLALQRRYPTQGYHP